MRPEGRGVLSIVVLTYPCETAALLLARLWSEGFAVTGIVLQRGNPARRLHQLVGAVGIRNALGLAWRRLRAALLPRSAEPWRSDSFYAAHAGRVVVVPRLNHPSSREALLALRPDIAVIGGAGILNPGIFTVPRMGTLNLHPGMLPRYRGLSSLCWAVLEGGEAGATLHFLDEGIDTGPVVARRLVAVCPGDTLEDLRRRVVDAGLELLIDALDVMSRGEVPATTRQPREEGRYYRMASASVRRRAEARLAALAKDAPRVSG